MKSILLLDDSYFSPKPVYTSSLVLRKCFAGILRLFRFLGLERSSQLPPDCFYTPHNKSFSLNPFFSEAYQASVEAIGSDYRIPWRVHQLLWAIQATSNVEGNICELGTGKGFMMKAAAVYIARMRIKKNIHLFDLFNKPINSGMGRVELSNYYADSAHHVEYTFSSHPNCFLHEGDVRETTKNFAAAVSLLHIDLNEPEIELAMLEHFYPLMSSGSIVLLDDFANRGFELSFELHTNFFNRHGLSILSTPAGQGIIIVP